MNLNERQRELLRMLSTRGPVSTEQLDGRTCRALLARGLVEESGGQVQATLKGKDSYQEPAPRQRTRRKEGARDARAEAIRRAADVLEAAIPVGSEVLVGPILAAAEDVVTGFRRYARTVQRPRADPDPT